MIIGFTGTQRGMTVYQKTHLQELLVRNKCNVFIHGDCIGSDAEAHDIASALGIFIVAHPCDINEKRAFKQANLIRCPMKSLERNKTIVDLCDLLLVAPKSNVEELRSGTWATKRYAQKINKPYIVIKRGDY